MRLVAVFTCVAMLTGLGILPSHAAADGLGARNRPFTMASLARITTPGTEASTLVRVAQDANQAAAAPDLTQAEVEKLFKVFVDVLRRIQTDYTDKPDDAKLLWAAVEAMQAAFPASPAMSATGDRPSQSSGKPASIGLGTVYATALHILNAQPSRTDDAGLVAVAINGMLASLDSKSSYMDAKSFRDMSVQNRGQFGGVGLEVSMEKGLVKVVSPIDESPAARAGIKANDMITHLDGQPVEGLTLDQAVEKMRGPVNTRIRLTIIRGQDKPFEVSITRDVIRLRSVRARLEGDDVGFIRLTKFDEQTTELLKQAVSNLTAQSGGRLKGFILDLRNNSGGLFDQAVSVCDAFLEKGEIVSTRGRAAGETRRFNARAGDLTRGKPLMVLIDGGSAAASEIVAGALQDHRRATVIGARSYGNGSVHTIIPLGSGNGALRLVTARFFTPSGRAIEATGISPDIEIVQQAPDERPNAEGGEQKRSRSYIPPDPKDDKVLQAAIERIRGENNSANPANSNAETEH